MITSSSKIFIWAISVLIAVFSAEAGWIDPDSPLDAMKTKSLAEGDDRVFELVFSDEFEQEGRTFRDGEDPRWTALNKNDITNNPLHYYSHDSISTSNGKLTINTDIHPKNFSEYNLDTGKYELQYKEIRSGMLQGWDKFCFTGGIFEFRATLPGNPRVGGLWPAVWMMGNLARATFINSTENMWPFSTNVCDNRTRYSQARNSCSNQIGRGAPEIDLLEVMYMDLFEYPILSTSLQVAPGVKNHRPVAGKEPNASMVWYNHLEYGNNTSMNTYFYGVTVWQADQIATYHTDAISSNTPLIDNPSYVPHTFRVEWEPPDSNGSHGSLAWFMDGEFLTRVVGDDLLNISGTEIPSEPMYLIMNTAISKDWGFPDAWFLNCKCKCWSCFDPCCQCGLPDGYCANFPAKFEIDYVRLYQEVGNSSRHNLGCSPPSRATKSYINSHIHKYMTADQKRPLLSLNTGGGACDVDSDCGNGRGLCQHNVCSCQTSWTGPHCQAHAGFYDDNFVQAPWAVHIAKNRAVTFVVALALLIISGSLGHNWNKRRRKIAYQKLMTNETLSDVDTADDDSSVRISAGQSYQKSQS